MKTLISATGRHVVLVATLLSNLGCASTTQVVVKDERFPRKSVAPSVTSEKKPRLDVKSALEGDNLAITVASVTDCRTVGRTKMLRRTKSETKLSDGGRTTQWWVGGASATLLVSGALMTVSKCPPVTGTAKDGKEYNNECLAGDIDKQKSYNTAGPVLIGAGVLLGGIFAWNAISASGTEERVLPAEDLVEATPWSECSRTAKSGAAVELALGSQKLSGATDEAGQVSFDLSKMPDGADLGTTSNMTITVDGAAAGSADIAQSPAFKDWKARQGAAAAERSAMCVRNCVAEWSDCGRQFTNSGFGGAAGCTQWPLRVRCDDLIPYCGAAWRADADFYCEKECAKGASSIVPKIQLR